MNYKLPILFLFILFSHKIVAQFTPQPSPGASLTQTIGVTKIYIEYSRPSAKGRKIFGELLPYGKIWRTGANAATLIELSNDIRLNQMLLPAGSYSIVSFPYETYWEIVFCSNIDISEETFTPECEVLRIKVPTTTTNFTETLTFEMTNLKDDEATLNIYWETTKVAISITVDNTSAILTAAAQINDETAGAFQQAAEYLLTNKSNLDDALLLIDKSIFLKETFRNLMIKAQILNELGKYKSALEYANKAKVLGMNTPIFSFFETQLQTLISDLKKKTI